MLEILCTSCELFCHVYAQLEFSNQEFVHRTARCHRDETKLAEFLTMMHSPAAFAAPGSLLPFVMHFSGTALVDMLSSLPLQKWSPNAVELRYKSSADLRVGCADVWSGVVSRNCELNLSPCRNRLFTCTRK